MEPIISAEPTSIDASTIIDDEIACALCESGENEDHLLLCDGCERGFHTYCLNMPGVPTSEQWYCPRCRSAPKSAPNAEIPALPVRPLGKLYQDLDIWVYLRVSTQGQDAPQFGRAGLRTQNNKITEVIGKHGLYNLGTVKEVGSGRDTGKLKELNALIRKKAKRGQCIVVYSVSRLSRNLAQGEQIIRDLHSRGVWVYSATEEISSHDEQFIFLLREAERESAILGQRVRAAHQRIRAVGGHIGPAPFGQEKYRDETGTLRLMANGLEQNIISILRRTYSETGVYRQTAMRMNAANLLRRGRPWTAATVKKDLGGLGTFGKDIQAALPEIDDDNNDDDNNNDDKMEIDSPAISRSTGALHSDHSDNQGIRYSKRLRK